MVRRGEKIEIRISNESKEKLEKISSEKGISVSDLVRNSLEKQIKEENK
jgi:predicted DNA-binding protein